MQTSVKSVQTVIFQLLKALCYLALFIGVQVIVSVFFVFFAAFGYIFANGVPDTAEAQLVYQEYTIDLVNRYTGEIEAFCTVLVLFFLWIFFLIRRKKFMTATNMVHFSKQIIPGTIILAVGVTFFCNTALNLLPEAWLNSYAEASDSLGQGPFWIMLFATGVCAPLMEEIIFRGLILSRLRCAMPTWISVLISSLLFGLVHGHPLWMAYTFLLGVVFCIVTVRSGSILPSMLMHAIFNVTGTCLSYSNFAFTELLFWGMLMIGIIFTVLGMYMILSVRTARRIDS